MQFRIEKLDGKVFVPFKSLENYLLSEFQERFSIQFDFIKNQIFQSSEFLNCLNSQKSFYSEVLSFVPTKIKCAPYFAKCIFSEPFLLHFDSITEAANSLKSIQRNWAPYSFSFFRRTSLIQEKLPYINLKVRQFPCNIPTSPIGCYTLLDEHTLLASGNTNSFLPAGHIQFVENHTEPPSRAYLKFQEALVMFAQIFEKDFPKPGEICFDAGASPGGWTWVLVNLGCKVFAVDRSELSLELMKNKNVHFQKHDAFTLLPKDVGKCDWVFSDVICYPERLYEWVTLWLESGLCKKMICTIKMQGGANWEIIQKFASIPNSKVIHLNYNKHELTWIHCDE